MKCFQSTYKLLGILLFVNIVLVFVTNSYIHPDEHYQSLEPLIKYLSEGSLNNSNGAITWEYLPFNSGLENPIRSITILYIYYKLILKWLLNAYGSHSITALHLVQLLKLYNLGLFAVIFVKFNNVFNKNCSFNKRKSVFYMFISYSVLTYQVRFFSNSIETLLLMLCLIFIKKKMYCMLSIFIAIGTHNRITFCSWLLLPGIVLIYKELIMQRNYKTVLLKLFAPIVLTSYLIFKADAKVYGSVYTPLQNILYNRSLDNLSKHGIHSNFTHVFINLPVLLGPLLIVLLFYGKKLKLNNVPLLSAISGVIVHSLIPHQEARFLLPAVPLVIVSCDFRSLNSRKMCTKLVVCTTVVFNLIMLVLMGSFHQSGLVTLTIDRYTLSLIKDSSIGYWHTLMPLHWPYYITLNETERKDLHITYVNDIPDESSNFRELKHVFGKTDLQLNQFNIFDFMGIGTENLKYLLTQLKDDANIDHMYIVLPHSFIQELGKITQSYEIVKHEKFHLNLNDGLSQWPFGLYLIKISF